MDPVFVQLLIDYGVGPVAPPRHLAWLTTDELVDLLDRMLDPEVLERTPEAWRPALLEVRVFPPAEWDTDVVPSTHSEPRSALQSERLPFGDEAF